MAEVPEALVEKAAYAVFSVSPAHDDTESWDEKIARAVLAAVWPDVRAEVNREQPDLMRQGYENGVGAMRTALAQVEAELADVRRQTAEEVAAAIEVDADAEAERLGGWRGICNSVPLCNWVYGIREGARRAREVGGDRG